ncbi:protein kinase domain-containing protein [Ruminococcus sp.]|uniref:protein kinase domain-containing protein n=1 Tax=Ruminococcus sp. TaxID=41978 RepID=UPI00386944F3
MKNYCYSCMNELTDGNICHHCLKENTADDIVYRLKAGTILNNKYLVGNCIGEGGFGITYIGRDLTLDMRVAIKEYFPNGYVNRNNTVSQDVTASTESQKEIFYKGKDSFLEEARKIAKFVGEPGIVSVREYFEANGTAYIIMDYLDGVNLASYVRSNGTIPATKIFEVMLPMVRSLKRIHEAGIIHRDISPDNIMYLKNGSLKLMDFGSARYFTNNQKGMSVLLKQGYAPEEQYRKNGDQGPWTDVYGLCATMYRCITGVIPVDALDRMRNDTLEPPSKLGVDIPESLEVVLLYGLAVFKENRCQDMDELADLMERALAKQKITVKNSQDVYADIDRAQAADGYYRKQTQKQFTGSQPTQPRLSTVNRASDDIPRHNKKSASPVPPNKTNKKAVTPIVITASVVIVAVITLIVFLLLPRSDKPTSDPASGSISSGSASITMPNCAYMSMEYAKTNLENAGLVVETEYEYSNDVTKDLVIKQSVEADSQVKSGSTVTLTVSKGVKPNPYDYDQKLTVSAASGSSSATATLYEWKHGDWSKLAEYDAKIGMNGIGACSEGSNTSPEGTHKLGIVLTKGDVSTWMETYIATPNTGVVIDTNSAYYNQIFEESDAPIPISNYFDFTSEQFSNAAIFIEFNGNGFSSEGVTPGAGSALFLRGKSGSLSATHGDVDISESDMDDLLSRLDPDKNPVIELTAGE